MVWFGLGCGFFYAGDCVLFSLRSLGEGKSAPFFGGEAQTVLFATGTLSQNSGVSFHVERGSPSPRGMWSSRYRCLQGEGNNSENSKRSWKKKKMMMGSSERRNCVVEMTTNVLEKILVLDRWRKNPSRERGGSRYGVYGRFG